MHVLTILRQLMSVVWFAKKERVSVRICDFMTTVRRDSSTRTISAVSHEDKIYHGRIELDSHADTIVFGKNCTVLHYTGRECDVSPYTDAYESIKSVPIAQAATAWTSQTSGITYILVFNEGLWMGDKMDHTLINPNQLRHYGVKVQDNPFDDAPLYLMTEDGDFALPLAVQRTNIMADTRTPTAEELQTCQHIILSSPHPWDPHRVSFPTASRTVQEEVEMMQRTIGGVGVNNFYAFGNGMQSEEAPHNSVVYDIDGISHRLISVVQVDANVEVQDVPAARTFESKERHTSVTPEDLSERWCIGLGQAKETLKRTTQRIVRSAVMPLARRYRADRMYEKRRLRGEWFTDTMDGRVVSKDGNRYGQVFANKGYFAQIYPMDTKSKAGDALRTFIQEFGVPENLTFDGSKEQTGKKTEFMKQVRKNDIDFHIIEPERHNQNPCEGVIREVRRKWFRTMIRKRVPRKLWDYGMRWVCETMQRTSTQAGGLNGCTPIEMVTGETVDISEYLDFGFLRSSLVSRECWPG